jgi:trans-aconitate methyltransferase
MSSEKPERIRWAVEVLSAQPKEKILEIGCGNGHAVELICKQLTTGKIVGIDRSAKAIHTAEANNPRCVNSGKAQFLNAALAEIKLNERFDKIFAVNVNVFWTRPEREIAALRPLMNKRSRLYLFYDSPSASQLEKVIENGKKHLEAEKFEIVDALRKRLTSNYSVCIMAKKVNA